MEKKAQVQMSMGMIFSIFLIIVILSFGGYVILKFIGNTEEIKMGTFIDDVQDDVDKLWRVERGTYSREEGYEIPSKIKKICFADFKSGGKGINREIYDRIRPAYSERSNQNLFAYPIGVIAKSSSHIEKINIEKSTSGDNPLCFEVKNGKVKFELVKEQGEPLVFIR